MMSLSARRELLASLSDRYKKARKAEKGRILDELSATSGYDRKYAISLLGQPVRPKRSQPPRKRRPTYGPEVGGALVKLWKVSGGLCAKRLQPILPDLIAALERHDEIDLPETLRAQLLKMSISTTERLLGRMRRQSEHGLSTTTPGTLLRNQIPIHTFADWQDAQPGFLEIDLVAHCGDTAVGQFVYTLTATDVATGWTECIGLLNRGQLAVLAGLEALCRRLPFPLRGIDTDNGAEFINFIVAGFCSSRKITFTRGRPYKKNDQAHVEQKNGAVVRPLIGYARYEGQEATDQLNKLYAVHRLHLNYFQPSMKLLDKKRNGNKLTKKYDAPKTPYARLIGYDTLDQEQKNTLKDGYLKLNPAALTRRIDELDAALTKHAVRTPTVVIQTKTIHRLPDNLFGKNSK
jgi:hypothetical protein